MLFSSINWPAKVIQIAETAKCASKLDGMMLAALAD